MISGQSKCGESQTQEPQQRRPTSRQVNVTGDGTTRLSLGTRRRP